MPWTQHTLFSVLKGSVSEFQYSWLFSTYSGRLHDSYFTFCVLYVSLRQLPLMWTACFSSQDKAGGDRFLSLRHWKWIFILIGGIHMRKQMHPVATLYTTAEEPMPLDQLISSMSASSSPCGVSIELLKYSTLPFTTNPAATDRVENDILWVLNRFLNRPWRKTCQRRVTGLFHLVSHS